MCGIAGYIGDVSREKILKMLQATSYRGPDDRGIFVKGNVGLGSNRLAVIDLSSKGHQPMFDEDREICIVYNGEIYNFLEVRRKLSNEFHFRSNSDTEVIVYAYKKWGVDCLRFLNGMFAFVIYDMKKGLLWGARDRLGEKPLKYFYDGRTFIFASEIKGILPVLKDKPNMDFDAINDFLTLQYVPTPMTGFKNIYKLPPASYFVFRNRRLKIYKYWCLNFSEKLNISEREWEDELEEKINKAVSQRLVSDVPIGSLLSGGVDSGCVTAFMAKNSRSRIKTFNISFSEPEFDESKYANLVARKYCTDHHNLKVNPRAFREVLIESAGLYDEPFADNSLIPSICLSRLVKKDVTVALSGDGGDENFAGYSRYGVVAFGERYKLLPRELRNFVVKPIADTLFALSPNLLTHRIKTFADTFDLPFYKKYLHYRSFFASKDKCNIFLNGIKKVPDTFAIHKEDYSRKLSSLDNALKMDIVSYLPEDLLFKIDIASMSVGLEVRAPLLDYKLVEFTAKMPSNLKIKNLNKKYIFKKMLVDKKILPEEIVNRPKMGFNPPYKKWLKSSLKDYVMETINLKKFRQAEIFDNQKLDDYLKTYFISKVDYSNNIFALVALAGWINRYF